MRHLSHKPLDTDIDSDAPNPGFMQTRRNLFALIGGSAALAFGLLGADSALAQKKTSKKVAKYQDHPNNGKDCDDCRYFRKPHSCQLVAGKISPHGWCSFFAQKT